MAGYGYLALSGATYSTNYRHGYYRGYNVYVSDKLLSIVDIDVSMGNKTVSLQTRENSSSTLTVRNAYICSKIR